METESIKKGIKLLQMGKGISIDATGSLSQVTFRGRLWGILNPCFANSKKILSATILMQNLEKVKLGDANATGLLELSELYYRKTFKRSIFCSKNYRRVGRNLSLEIKLHALAQKLQLQPKDLHKDFQFVHFAYQNHFHHRIDNHFQKKGITIHFNQKKGVFELPLKTAIGSTKWVSWRHFPTSKRGEIKGYDFLAYGLEQHNNKTWERLKPCKILNFEEFPEYSKVPHIELVTTYPTFKNRPGFFGHIYLNFYVPVKEKKIEFYSLCYDLKLIRFPDPMEFFTRKKIKTARPISFEDWKNLKSFIEKIQETHLRKEQDSLYKHPDLEVEHFYREYMKKNCGNFACALFEKATGTKGLFTFMPIMKVLFPKFLYKIEDWLEDHLPKSMKYIIVKVNIVVRGVMPWELIPKQKELNHKFKTLKPGLRQPAAN